MNTATGAAGAIAALAALLDSHQIQSSALLLAILVAVDTLGGLWLAAVRGQIRSWKMTKMLVSKLVQYGILLTIFTGIAFLAREEAVLLTGLNALCLIEVLSMMETAIQLEDFGINLRLVKPLLNRIRKYVPADLPAESEKERIP